MGRLNKRFKDKDKKLYDELIKIFGKRCWYCGINISSGFGNMKDTSYSFDKDHIIPRRDGGKDEIENRTLSCGNCNRAKGAQNIVYFLKWISFIRSSKFQCSILNKLSKKEIEELDDGEWDLLRKD